ncbi:hypothetical protein GA707_13845 [Nostocoides sp. F2B08]|uniref:hypothetical protein n=1 Tax=Nostocoides sp. F2B08 TaxID=2653936 RepID=UPI0012635A02|nr:hypothetical protein [Tetrasphaera sp. F2B08]KAB7743200.1 hypothetical protein GA707_13845 [Tetrasphaera sp. F2B08]
MTAITALLPVRLETRFHGSESSGWRLRLRLVPDTISFDTHDPAITPAEQLALSAFWGSLRTQQDAADPAAAVAAARQEEGWADAFARLAGQVGAGRAHWLVGTVANPTAEPLEVQGVLRGLPPQVQVWAKVSGNSQPVELGLLEIMVAALEAPTAVAEWLVDWAAAVDVGLAKEITLPMHPKDIEVLGVSGCRDDGTLAQLLAGHAAEGNLLLSGPGAATTGVHGQPVPLWNAPFVEPDSMPALAERTLHALGAGDLAVRSVGDDDVDQLLLRLTFPTLFGYGLTEVTRAVERLEIGTLWKWAAQWLRPQGTYATLAVGDTSYGVLPVVYPGSVPLDGLEPLQGMLPGLEIALRNWAEAARTDEGAVGDGVEEAVRTLRRGPVPGDVAGAPLLRTELLAHLAGGDVDDAMDRWQVRNREAFETSLSPEWGLRYDTLKPGLKPLGVPLLVGDEAALHPLLDWLGEWRSQFLEPYPVQFDQNLPPVVALYVATRWESTSNTYVEYEAPQSMLVRLFRRSIALAGGGLDLWRQALGAAPVMTEPEPFLGEHLERVESTRLREHLIALAEGVLANGSLAAWVNAEARALELATQLTWLGGDGMTALTDLLIESANTPEYSLRAERALRALIETASGRWDVWWHAVGAHHVAKVVSAHGAPTTGLYGWVDRPFRGTPGPGPGGLLLAPSTAQAATAAALRDRAVHEPSDRWQLRLNSSLVGPARTLLERIGDDWHPAEVVGRMVESEVTAAALEVGVVLGAADLQPIRTLHPLRVGQGQFGCCHGLDVLADGGLPDLVRAPGLLARAVSRVRDVVQAASDLVLAEALHGVLAGRPERAAVATEFLAGQGAPGPLQVLDPMHEARQVRTLVLAGLPSVGASGELGTLGALGAAPAFDAALRSAVASSWTVSVPGGSSVALTELGLSAVHAVVLDEAALVRLAALRLGLLGTPVVLEDVVGGVPEAPEARSFAAAVAGSAPHPSELVASAAADVGPVLATATAGWEQRLDALASGALNLVDAVLVDVAAARSAWEAEVDRLLGLDADGAPPPVDVPADLRDAVASRLLDVAAWGFSPPPEAPDLFALEVGTREAALVASLAALDAAAGGLSARVLAAGYSVSDGALTRTGSLGPGALAELGAGRSLPVGTPAPVALLGEPLAPVPGTATADSWMPLMARLRPSLGRMSGFMGSLLAVAPEDPWRVAALTGSDEPRFTVVLDAGSGPEREWVVLDSFSEQVPLAEQHLGVAFDAATPSACPPQAVLLVPAIDPDAGVTQEELTHAVLLARAMAHARMATTKTLADAGLGALAATCVLPQDWDTGAPISDDGDRLPTYDLPVALLPRTTNRDTDELVAGTTADAAWMVGLQWRIGEHLGEDAATPVRLDLYVSSEPITEALLASQPAEAVLEKTGWRPSSLDHAGTWSALQVPTHDAGPLDWWSLRLTPPAPAAPVVAVERHVAHPTRLEWPGQPRRRYWEVEDVEANPLWHPVDRAHPATLHLVELVNRLGDDWYLAPMPGRAGEFTRIRWAAMTDAMGAIWSLSSEPGWSLFAVEGDDVGAGGHRSLPVLLWAAGALEGKPFEEIALAVDEDANLLWAALLRGQGLQPAPTAEPTLGAVPVGHSVPDDGAGHVARMSVLWELGGMPPLNRVPYLYGGSVRPGWYGHGRDLFVQARIRDPLTGQLAPLPTMAILPPPPDGAPHTLLPLAVPSSGIRLSRRLVLARDVDGNPVFWERTERRPLDVSVDVDLRWDTLNQRPPVTETGA